jgi:uncharacterized protein (TIGR02271 family)
MVNRLYNCQVVDPDGEKVGSVKRVWLDGRTGDPVWASVHTGLFGLKETFVPLQRAELREDRLMVPVAKDRIKDAPRIEAEGDQMSDTEQAALYRHYGFTEPGAASGQRPTPGSSGSSRRPATAGGDDAMTRSEERLKVGTEQVETGRVRLVRHVVTEEQQISVPVSHEEVRLEREPITDASPGRGAEISESEYELSLHAERPIVDKETVPVERVRLTKDTVTEQQTVGGQVRKERIDVEDGSGQLSEDRRPPRNQR